MRTVDRKTPKIARFLACFFSTARTGIKNLIEVGIKNFAVVSRGALSIAQVGPESIPPRYGNQKCDYFSKKRFWQCSRF